MAVNPLDNAENQIGEIPSVCPFLKLADDSSVRYSFPSQQNTCYHVNPPQGVALTYQDEICLTGKYFTCPVFDPAWAGPLPLEVRGKPLKRVNAWPLLLWSGIILMSSVLLVSILSYSLSTGLLQSLMVMQSTVDTSGKSWIVASPTSSITPVLTSSPISVFNLRVTITPTMPAESETALSSTMVGVKKYLVHTVINGETFEQISQQFYTSPEVIKKVNFLNRPPTLRAGETIAIIPWLTDPIGLVPLRVVYIDQKISLTDFLTKYPDNETFIRDHNTINNDWIDAGTWVIIPNVTPTPTLTSSATNITPTAPKAPTKMPSPTPTRMLTRTLTPNPAPISTGTSDTLIVSATASPSK